MLGVELKEEALERTEARALLERIAALLTPSSARYGEAERALYADAERSLLEMRPCLRRGTKEEPGDEVVLAPLVALPGDVGTEARLCAWAAGLGEVDVRPVSHMGLARRLVDALAQAGKGPLAVIEEATNARFGPSIEWEDLVDAIADDADSLPLLRHLGDPRGWPRDESRLEVLCALLRAGPAHVRLDAVKALAGEPLARPAIRSRLGDEDRDVREAAVTTLADDPESWPLLRRMLEDQSEKVRAAVVKALADDPESWPLLRPLLARDVLPHLRAAAVLALARDEAVRPIIEQILRHERDEHVESMIFAAAKALANAPDARPLLLDVVLRDEDVYARAAAIEGLAAAGAIWPELRPLVRDEHDEVQWSAVRALVRSASTWPDVLALLQEGDPVVRSLVREAIVHGEVPSSLLPSLLEHEDNALREAAAKALGSAEAAKTLAPSAARRMLLERYVEQHARGHAEPGLATNLNPDAYWSVRRAAVEALARPGAGARQAIEGLLQAAGRTRMDALDVLIGMGRDERQWPALRDMLEEKWLRVVAPLSLARGGRVGIAALLHHEDAHVRGAAILSLGDDRTAWPAIHEHLRDGDAMVRIAAVLALAMDDGARPLLRQCLRDENALVRAAAAQALVRDETAHAELSALLEKEEEHGEAEFAICELAPSALADDIRLRLFPPGASPQPARADERIEGVPLLAHPSICSALTGDRLAAFLRAPHRFTLDDDPALAESLLGWLCLRLGCASEHGRMEGGLFYGELASPAPPSLCKPGRSLVLRVAMNTDALVINRFMVPMHNLVEAHRIARHLDAADPPSLLLACTDGDFAELDPPSLAPGELCAGPVFFGLRLARA
jgi:HEAT repeat protein